MSLQPTANPTESLSVVIPDDSLLDGHPASHVFIELRTDPAFRLVIGRPRTEKKPAINGLLSFASLLRDIWDAAKAGDPYARWWLVKVEAALARAETIIEPELTAAQKDLSACSLLQIDPARGRRPRRLDLLFACPYAYYGARLVKQLDVLIKQLDTAIEIGVLRKPDATHPRLRGERALRHAFASAQGFWKFGITSELVRCRDPKAIDAEAKMGVLPHEILTGECWPALLDEYAVTPVDRSEDGNG